MSSPSVHLDSHTASPSAAEIQDGVAQVGLNMFGVTLSISADGADLMQRCLSYLPVGWKPAADSDRASARLSVVASEADAEGEVYRLYQEATEVASSPDVDYIGRMLGLCFTECLAGLSRSHLFLHAGAVGWRDCGILLPGQGRSGKSSLVAELVRAGAVYYSDDVAVLDSRGRLCPYARYLRLRDKEGRRLDHPVESLGGKIADTPLSVGLVLFTRYDPGVPFSPSRLSQGQGILRLIEHLAGVGRDPSSLLEALSSMGSDVRFLEGARPEAGLVTESILQKALFESGSNGSTQ